MSERRDFPWAIFIIFAVFLTLGHLAARKWLEKPPAAAPAPQLAQAAPDAPTLYTLKGAITLEDDDHPAGSIVFCAGASHIALTDEDGRYVISNVPPGQYHILVKRERYALTEIDEITLYDDPDGEEPREISLRRAHMTLAIPPPARVKVRDRGIGLLRGVVQLDDKEISPANVRVAIESLGIEALPDSTGRYTFPDLPATRYTLVFSLDGYESVSEKISIQPDTTTTLPVLTLAPLPVTEEVTAGAILGKILFLDPRGQVVENKTEALVRIVETAQTTPASADGSFLFEGIDPGQYTLRAEVAGYSQTTDKIIVLDENNSAIAILILQEEKCSLTGKITLQSAGGESLAGSQVAMPGTGFSSITDARGQFKLANVPTGSLTLLCMRNGYKTTEISGIEVSAGEEIDVGVIELERDIEAPNVLGTIPEDGTRDLTIIPTNVIRVSFSKRMDLATLRSALSIRPECAWTLRRVDVNAIEDSRSDIVDIQINNTRSSSGPLRFNTTYKFAITTAAQDQEGNPLEENYTFAIATGGLKALMTYPPDGARGISVQQSSRLVVHFNGVVDPDTIIGRNVSIRPEPSSQSPVPYFDIDPVTGWTIFHNVPMSWNFDTKYTVELGRGIRTIDGVSMDRYKFGFQTQDMDEVR